MKKIMMLAVGLLTLVTGLSLYAFGSQHSSMDAKAVVGQKGELTMTFKIAAGEGMMLTHQAPWSVTLTEVEGAQLEGAKEGKFETLDYDKELPGFTVKTTSTADKGSANYKMKAFVCTKDKSRCFPQTHKGKISW